MTTLQDHQIPRDLVECLRIEARNAANPPTEYVLADDGGRMVHKPKPDLDMAELLDQAANRITADGATIDRLQAENARLRKLIEPEWFYLAGDTSSERCRFSTHEVIDEDWLWDNRASGSAVVHIETAARCPDIWCAVKFFTNTEKDERQSDEEYEFTEHATEEEARDALAAWEASRG